MKPQQTTSLFEIKSSPVNCWFENPMNRSGYRNQLKCTFAFPSVKHSSIINKPLLVRLLKRQFFLLIRPDQSIEIVCHH